MSLVVTFSRGTIDHNREYRRSDPPIWVWPEGGSLNGLITRCPCTLIYDPEERGGYCDSKGNRHAAYLRIEGDDVQKAEIARSPKKLRGVHYVYVQRDAVKARKRAPCLTMKRGSDNSRYASRIEFPDGATIVYTTDTPFLGGNGDSGARLWIETPDEPLPVPGWHDNDHFRRCCGYS